MVFLAVTLAAVADPLALARQAGPFATMDADCSGCEFKNRQDDSAFFVRQGEWYVALHAPDGWYHARLPIQDGVTPGRITEENGVRRVTFHQHAFSRSVDTDAEWIWPCAGGSCTVEAVPTSLTDHQNDIQVDAQLIAVASGSSVRLDVVFTKLKIGDSAEWRAHIARLRGSHSFSAP
jgi:hypothetical protein